MNKSTGVEIHEFRTGIHPEKTANGWVSRGFTGQYMNATIDPIPYAVERSIANKEFAVAEGASSDQPAVIGRVVGSGESAWSVIAIITRGKDEKGRSASFYRYFLCEGDGHLSEILARIEDYRGKNGQMPVFDPFEIKRVGSPNNIVRNSNHTYTLIPKSNEASEEPLPSDISNESLPVIIPPSQYKVQKINNLAIEIAKNNSQPIAWAFNVEALEQPGRFQLIQAASDSAYKLLQRAKNNAPKYLVQVVADEQAIKSAIRGLINSSTVKPEHVEALADSLANDQVPDKYWRDVFDSQGAANALKQGIYTSQMVRLLILRAIIVPETLPEYVEWLKKRDRQNEDYKMVADFESQIIDSLKKITKATNIKININEGIQNLIYSLTEEKVNSEVINRLLTSPNGVWANSLREFIRDLSHDLNLMPQFASGQQDLPFKLKNDSWNHLWKNLKIYWQSNACKPNLRYKVIAHTLESLDFPKESALFYQISYGRYYVPKQLFYKMNIHDMESSIYGLKVTRKPTAFDYLRIFYLATFKVGEIDLKVFFVLPLLLLSMGVGFFVPHTNSDTSNKKRNPQANLQTNPKSLCDQVALKANDETKNINSPKKEFEKIISDIISQGKTIKPNKVVDRTKIITKITEILSSSTHSFEYEKAVNNQDNDRSNLLQAIHEYKKTKICDIKPFELDNITIDLLKKDITQQLFY